MVTTLTDDIDPLVRLVDKIDALVHCVSATGELLFANNGWRNRLGYSTDDLASRRIQDIVTVAQRTRSAQQYTTLFAGGEIGTVHTQLLARDAKVVDVEGSLLRVLLADGTTAALGLFTERRLAANAPFKVPVSKQVTLTTRQLEVLQLFASGHTTKQVAAELDIAVKTVHNHLTTIYRLLEAQSLVQATMIAAQLGLVELAAPLH